MRTDEKSISSKISDLLENQQLAVLSTVRNGQPYTSLMAYIFSEDLKELVVATDKSAQKYQNIVENSSVSLLVDNRSVHGADFQLAQALSIIGNAHVVETSRRAYYQSLYLHKHPSLKGFLAAESTTIFRIEVSHYLLVSEFQNVMEYRIG